MMSREKISHVAAEWLARRHSGQWSENQEQELAAWLKSNPDHRREFDVFESLWSDLDQAKDAMAADSPDSRYAESRSMRWKTSQWVASCALLALIVMGLIHYYRSVQPVFQKALVTGSRQRLESTLPDGSKLALNIDSRAAAVFFRDRREVLLTQGEVFFDVTQDAERPFLVRARNINIRVLGTAFNVYLTPDDVRVSVNEGQVEIIGGTEGNDRLVLKGGQAVKLSESVTRYDVEAPDVGTWRSGQVVFRNQLLSEVLKEVSRYRARPIRLAGADIGERRLSGVLNVDNPESFIDALPKILPVLVQRKPDGTVLVTSK